jgi:hypothetical protein
VVSLRDLKSNRFPILPMPSIGWGGVGGDFQQRQPVVTPKKAAAIGSLRLANDNAVPAIFGATGER